MSKLYNKLKYTWKESELDNFDKFMNKEILKLKK